MKILEPKSVSDSVLKSSSVPEADHPAWATGTTYAKDALVMHDHAVWKSLQESNTGKQPDLSLEWWSKQGPTVRWAMFDNAVGTQTSATGSITVELDFGRCTGFALFGLDATSLTAEVRDSTDSVIWSESTDLTRDPTLASWLDYFTEPVRGRAEYVRTGLPIYAASTLRITLAKPSGAVGVGNLVIGRERFIGLSRWGVQAGMSDWSRKTTDPFGNVYLAQGNWAKTTRLDLHVESSQLDTVYRSLAGVRGTPIVAIGDNRDIGFDAITVFGYVSDFNVVIDGPRMSACSLEIQGLI